MATVLEHAPAKYTEILRASPPQARASYTALRQHIREWCLISRLYDADVVDDMQGGTSAPMDIGQVKGKLSKEKWNAVIIIRDIMKNIIFRNAFRLAL